MINPFLILLKRQLHLMQQGFLGSVSCPRTTWSQNTISEGLWMTALPIRCGTKYRNDSTLERCYTPRNVPAHVHGEKLVGNASSDFFFFS